MIIAVGAASTASRNRSSARSRSDTSRTMSTAPTSLPFASNVGAALPSTGSSPPLRPTKRVWAGKLAVRLRSTATRAGLSITRCVVACRNISTRSIG
ncbi:Uncharacterised protein [Burkholderia pseudomallei]|nr:Uncharacterised protein [Burkholderia pseudomallei]